MRNARIEQSIPRARSSFGLESCASIPSLAEFLRQQLVSPVDVVASCLERIERLEPRLGAFITVTAESAAEEAKAAERDIARGKRKGFLHGIPVGIKDFYDTAGISNDGRIRAFQGSHPRERRSAGPEVERRRRNHHRKNEHAQARHGNDRVGELFWTREESLESRFHCRWFVERIGGGGCERHVLCNAGH